VLLEARIGETIILKQIRATGTRLALNVDALIRLKAAGASDELLEALLDGWDRPGPDGSAQASTEPEAGGSAVTSRPGSAPIQAAASSSFRVLSQVNDAGERVLLVTNLDASGRRIGGELEPRSGRNVVHERVDTAPSASIDSGEHARQAPVIVNIHPPPAEGEPMDGAGYDEPEPAYPGGLYPAYAGFGLYGFVPAHHRHGPSCVHRGGRYGSFAPDPPGSWSHFLRYHHPGAGAGILDTAPYRKGTAASRNRRYFRR
ncbi:MAG TPA: hypothetical protein VFP98_01195, partial [Candidatus Polarisedimenticolia bacterium]|nr:hypothetical protein [Candidatus Polarisedimenticolia bacterium]